MFRLAFRNFAHLCRANVSFFLLSTACLFCAFAGLLFIQERGYYVYQERVEAEQNSQLLYFKSDDSNAIERIYSILSNDPELPDMKNATLSDGKYAGVLWTQDSEVWYTPFGRFFNTEEMHSGAYVAILGTSYLSQYPSDAISAFWETGVTIDGVKFDAIGNYFFNWTEENIPDDIYQFQLISAPITIPLRTYIHMGFSAKSFRCVFARPLTSAQIDHIKDIMDNFSVHSVSLPELSDNEAIRTYIAELSPYALVIILSLINITSVIVYWLRKEFRRYTIYLICGAQYKQIILLQSINVFLLVTIAYFFAYFAVVGLTIVVPDGILSHLPWRIHTLMYIGALFFTLLLINIRSIPIVFWKQKFDS